MVSVVEDSPRERMRRFGSKKEEFAKSAHELVVHSEDSVANRKVNFEETNNQLDRGINSAVNVSPLALNNNNYSTVQESFMKPI